MYTINSGNKTVSVHSDNIHYIIGFKNVRIARKVQYNMHPEPIITIIKNPETQITNNNVHLNNDVTLFIPKAPLDLPPAMRDGGYHIHEYKENDFMALPSTRNIGIIIPIKLQEETNEEFVFKSILFDPMFNYYGFKI